MVDGKPAFLLPKWVRIIFKPLGNAVVCKIGGSRRNIFNLSTLSYVFDKALFATDVERDENLIIVSDGEHFNLVDDKCNVLLKRWANNITFAAGENDEHHEGYVKVIYDDGVNLYNYIQHGFVSRRNYDEMEIIDDNFVKVGINQQDERVLKNILDDNGEPLFNDWSSFLYKISTDGYYLMNVNNTLYLGNIHTGEYLSDNGIFNNKENGKFGVRLEKNGKVNFLNIDELGKNNVVCVLPQWADSVTDFNENGEAIAVINGKEYILNRNGEGSITEKTNEGMQ
jgi:hypothetical protein